MLLDVTHFLRQRPPFLFIESASGNEAMTELEAETVFRADSEFFRGHFPDDPVVPGVILLETMAQSARLLVNARAGGPRAGLLMGVESVKFNERVGADEPLRIRTQLVSTSELGTHFKSSCFSLATGRRCARAQLTLQSA